MAHFRGTLKGQRNEVSRLGTAKSGLYVTAASWQGAVIIYLYEKGGIDYADVCLTKHNGAGTKRCLYHGPVSGLDLTQEETRQEAV